MEAAAVASGLAATLAGLAPFVLHLEDLHEASPERLDLVLKLADLVTRTRGVGLLVTGRAELPRPFTNHRLDPLTREESDALARAEMKAGLPDEGLAYLFSRAGGNPLFTIEFARYLARGGSFWSDGERWHWRAPVDGYLPVTVEAMVSQLVSDLVATPQARVVLEARAILPPTLADDRAWAAVAGVGPETFSEVCRALERAGVLRDSRFTHPLIGEVVAHELPGERRRALARRAVAALERDAPELAAGFVGSAGLADDEALALLERASDRAQGRGDGPGAARLMGIAAGYASGDERVRLALEAETGLLSTGDYRQRERLARLALETQPANREARFALGHVQAQLGRLGEVEALLADLPEAERHELRWLDLLFRAQAMAQRAADAVRTWREHSELARQPGGRGVSYAVKALCDLGDLAAAEALTIRTLEGLDLHLRTRGLLVTTLAYIRSTQGRYEESGALHDQSVALKRQDGHMSNLATGLYERAINLERLGRLDEARRDITEAVGLYDGAGNAREAANGGTFLGHLLARGGNFLQAESALLEANDVNARFGLSLNRVNCETELGLLYAEWGPPHGATLATKFARDALEHARALDHPYLTSHALNAAARVAAWQGDGHGARSLANEAFECLDPDAPEDRHQCLVALARALEANAEPARALENWREALELARSLELQAEAREAELEIARLEGDPVRGRALLEWFEGQGLGASALRARRYFLDAVEAQVRLPACWLSVLGPVELERDSQPVPTRARKRLEILAYLLEARLAGRGEAGALELLDALYPGAPEVEARHTLKQQVYLIRSTLGAESVVSTPSGYALGNVSSDAEEALRSPDHDPELWRGAYLGDLHEGWHAGVREALVLALRARAESLLGPNPAEAGRLGLILLEMEPYDAAALRLATGALERAGNLKAARATLREGAARLLEVGEALPEVTGGLVTLSATAL